MHITKATPQRRTRVTFGRFDRQVLQPAIFVSRSAAEMQFRLGDSNGLTYLMGIGLRLRGNSSPEYQWEHTGVQERAGVWAPGLLGVSLQRQPELDGVTYASGIAATGMPMRIKRVGESESWEKRLDADELAFPGPLPEALGPFDSPRPAAVLDRLFVSNEPHLPNDQISFAMWVPGLASANYGQLARFYFSGPAGQTATLSGYGQYCLTVSGGGEAVLFERGVIPGLVIPGWYRRRSFRVKLPGADSMLQISIASDATNTCDGSWRGRTMTIATRGFSQGGFLGSGVIGAAASAAITAIEASAQLDTEVYEVPGAENGLIQPERVRVDARRDLRVMANAFDTVYAEDGVLEDAPIDLATLVVNGAPLVVDVYCDRPAGTSVTVQLRLVDGIGEGTLLNGTVVVDDCRGLSVAFALPNSHPLTRTVAVRLTVTGDGQSTPTITQYVLRRAPTLSDTPESDPVVWPSREPTGRAFAQRTIESVSLTGQTADTQGESATVALSDLTASEPSMRMRSGIPVDIDVVNDAGELVTRLFRGIVSQPTTTWVRAGRGGYPAPGAWRGEFALAGEWRRLSRRLTPTRISLWDAAQNLPLKATDAIRELLRAGGWPDDQILIPDIPIRMIGATQDDLIVAPDMPIDQVVSQIASDYLGSAVLPCPNSGENGGWRLIEWPKPPYHTVLRFTPFYPGGLRLKHVLGAYGSVTGAGGQNVQVLPMFRRSMSVEPPEGNAVIVIGNNSSSAASGETGNAVLAQTAYNVSSFNALNLPPGHPALPDPTSPDFLGEFVPIVIRDGTLSDPAAMAFVTRRAYDAACFHREILRFTSILPFFVDVRDPYQTRPRMPRIGDMVEVETAPGVWTQYAVAQCSPKYRKSGFMFAEFELVRSGRFDRVAVPIGSRSGARMLGAVFSTFAHRMGQGTIRTVMAGNEASTYVRQRWGGLPSQTAAPIQDLDPSSPTFGEFTFLPGYDPVP